MDTVAVIFGGRSAEHDVSIVTAISSIIKPLELTRRYKVEAVYISKDGAWYWGEELKHISLFSTGKITDYIRKTNPVSVQLDGGMTLIKSSGIAGRKTARKIDLVFPSMHGTYGEDGALMGLLDLAGIPYVGCGVSASAVAMNKLLSKQIVSACGMPTTKYLSLTKNELEQNPAQAVKSVIGTLKFPLFIKPVHLGSSIGITKAENESELRNGLEVAAHYDDTVIVEEAVTNLIEVTLPVMGNDQPVAALLEKPLTKSEDFFDFDTKYLGQGKGGKKTSTGKRGSQGYSEVPAKLPKDLYARAESMGLSVYKALGCSGIARVDMLIDAKTEKIYFNEVNPLPGSLYAHNWRAAGYSNVDLVEKLIVYAKERYMQRKSLATSFNTNFLQQF